MKYSTTFALLVAAMLIAGCGKDDAGGNKAAAPAAPAASGEAAAPAAAAPAAAPDSAAAPAAEPAPMMSADGATKMIDHSKDEIEFMLKKSLAGWESLLEDVSDSEQVAMIEKEIASLKSKLEAM
jgi:zona occludens toxin (predicted ATPase)